MSRREEIANRCMLRLPAAARFAENARSAIDDATAEAHALGRSEGFAEGVEAARVLWVRGEGHKIRTLRAPSPVTGAVLYEVRCGHVYHPGDPPCACVTKKILEVEAERVRQESEFIPRAPSPKEDAPRCPECDGRGWSWLHPVPAGFGYLKAGDCPACGGTGRSTTGGGR